MSPHDRVVSSEHRRIAHLDEHLFNTEEAARFESCSAYQSSSREILFISHCVPNPPDKGEKIRAYHLLRQLLPRYRVHLVCFTRNPADIAHAHALQSSCASVYVELLPPKQALLRAGFHFAFGQSLTTGYYRSPKLQNHLRKFSGSSIAATVAFSSAMVPYAPQGIPLVIDMVDVDSEKWEQYGDMRFPGFLYRTEAARLRKVERAAALRAGCTFLTTTQERHLLESIAPGARVRAIENGVDLSFFDPARVTPHSGPQNRPYVAFVGVMDYFPNADACRWFATSVLDTLRRRIPDCEFAIVGRDPSPDVKKLGELPGVRVIGPVPDVRPYVAGARAVVVPLRIARGVQNKVLEALAMGKPVLASEAVCRTLGQLPPGVTQCLSPGDYADAIAAIDNGPRGWQSAIREGVRHRFEWDSNMRVVLEELEARL